MKTLVHEFVTTIAVPVPHEQKRDINRALNKHYTGSEEVPFSVKCPKELQDAAWRMNAVHHKTVKFKIYSDGSYDCEFVQ